ncbi:MAG: NnrS family protein [Pseudomonadota bacterium]|nr:NnrS family protein [Pseudomonadota bacterium]
MNTIPQPRLSIRLLGRAPHRLMFFIGVSNLMLAMAWWAAWLLSTRWPLFAMPQPRLYAGWLHAFVMQYQVLPSFFFGFLLTTFPRWIGLPDIPRWRFLPIGIGLFGGQLVTLLGALSGEAGMVIGALLTLAGWCAGLVALGPLLLRDTGRNWHARSCYAALLLGLVGLLAWIGFLLGASVLWAFTSIKIGTF